jgi:hypothetical protein
MQFTLLWIDLFLKDNNIGFALCSLRNYDDFHRSLFAVYWNDGELLIDLFWFWVH